MRKIVLILALGLVLILMIVPNAMAQDMTLVIFRAEVIPDPDHPVDPVVPGEDDLGEADLQLSVIGPNDWEWAEGGVYSYNDNDVHPFWTFHWEISEDDYPAGIVPLEIILFDEDGGSSEMIDINPEDLRMQLDIDVDYRTGLWTGDTETGYSMGDGDIELGAGGQQGVIFFGITLSPAADTDGDGIPDYIELHGIDYLDDSNEFQTDTAIMGDPCRESIAVQVDYLDAADHAHRPVEEAINEAVEMFDNAPRSAVTGAECPYHPDFLSREGIDLKVEIAENAISAPDVLEYNCRSLGSGVINLNENFPFYRSPYYHHSIWIHKITDKDTPGLSCNNHEFFVALGHVCDQDYHDIHQSDGLYDQFCDRGITQNGGTRLQSNVFVHELGHNLGLSHGGGDDISDFKPNYLSVMSYKWHNLGLRDQFGNTWIDYSRDDLGSLDKRSLDEAIGIPNDPFEPPYYVTSWADLDSNLVSDAVIGPLDWNNNGYIDEDPVCLDVDGRHACIACGDDGHCQSERLGDDVFVDECWFGGPCIESGPDRCCESIIDGDDVPYYILNGYNDWANIKFRAAMAPEADGPPIEPFDEPTIEEIGIQWSLNQQGLENYWSPDLSVTKSVDTADAYPGDELTYTVTVTNIGTGPATSIELRDILPDEQEEIESLDDLAAGASTFRVYTFTVPISASDMMLLVNTANVTATNIIGEPENDLTNNLAEASTLIHTPVLTLSKTATSSVNAGEAITCTLTYQNTGSADAEEVTITDTLPRDVYYSTALDLGSGPQPDMVTSNADGTTTLSWTIGNLTASSSIQTITYTTRPSLLFLAGTSVSNTAALDFTDSNKNDYPALTASASTIITSVIPGKMPLSLGYYRTHPEVWTAEILALIQATDTRFDANADGILSPAEVTAVFAPGGNQPKVLLMQLLATDFNLATRQITAGTSIKSRTATKLGLTNVRAADIYAMDTLKLPVNKRNKEQYSDITTVLDEINSGKSGVY